MPIIGSSKLQIAGDITASGAIVAEEFKTDFISGSILFNSGSTRFGDTRDDTHEFTGSISLSGSNVSFLGDSSVGIGTSSPARKLEIKDTSSNVGIRLTTGTALDAIIDLGDTGDADIGQIRYDNNTDKMHFRTNASDRLIIDSSGNIEAVTGDISGSVSTTGSFGATHTNRLLITGNQPNGAVVAGPGLATLSNGYLYLTGASSGLIIGDDSFDNRIQFANEDYILIETNATERLRILDGGNIGIGTSVPSQLLTVAGNISGSGNLDIDGNLTASGDAYFGSSVGIGTSNPIRMLDIVGSTAAMNMDSAGNAFITIDRGAANDVGQIEFKTAGSAKWYVGMTDSGNFSDGSEFFIGEGSGAVSNRHLIIDASGNIEFQAANAKISGSISSTGSFGSLVTSGDIQAGGSINIPFGEVISFEGDGGNTRVYSNQEDQIFFDIGGVVANVKFQETNNVFAQRVTTLEDFVSTATGMAFSGSITSTGSFGRLQLNDTLLYDNAILDVGRSAVADPTILIDSATGGDPQLIFDTGASNRTGIIQFKDEGTVAGFIKYEHNGDKMNFGAASSTSIRMTVSEAAIEFPTANVKISGSVTSTGSFGRVEADIFSGSFHGQIGARFVFTQSTPATTWTIQHNLGTQYPNVTVYDESDEMVLPTSVTATNTNTMTLTFNIAVAGVAMIGLGGHSSNQGRAFVFSKDDASSNWAVTHSLGEQYPAVTVYDESDRVIIPENIHAVGINHAEIFFDQPISGKAHFSVGNGLPGINSSNAGNFMRVNSDGTNIEYTTSTADVTGSFSVTGSVIVTGSIGVNIKDPSGAIDIFDGPGDNKIRFHNSSTGVGTSNGSRIGLNGSELFVNNIESSNIKLYTGTTQTQGITIDNSGNVGIGETSPDGLLHIKGSTPNIIFEDTSGGSNSAILKFKKTSASEADDDALGEIDFRGLNDADEETLYSYMVANSTDVSDGTEDGKLSFYVMNNGAIPKLLELVGTKISGSAASTGSFGQLQIAGDTIKTDSGGRTTFIGDNAEVIAIRSNNANGSHIIFEESTTARGYVGIAGGILTSGGDNFAIRSEADLLFATNGNNTRMTIDNGGDVLIATNDAKIKADSTNTLNIQAHQLKILGSGGEERFQLQSEGNSNPGVFMIKQSEETTTVQLNSDGNSYLNGGNIGIGTSSPAHKLDVVGDVRVRGDLTAETLIISSSVTNLTTQFSSGSTRFGDTQDDIHEITGSVNITGSMTVSNKLGVGTTTIDGDSLLHLKGTDNTAIFFEDDDDNQDWRINGTSVLQFYDVSNSREVLRLGTQEAVFNESGADLDFRIEGDTNSNLFTVDAGNERVGIGLSPSVKLHVTGSSSATATLIEGNTNGNVPILHVKDRTDMFVALFEGNRAGDTGAVVSIYHNPATSQETNRTMLNFQMNDDGDTRTTYAQLFSAIEDHTNGTEDGNLQIKTVQNGTLTEQMRIDALGNVGIGVVPDTTWLSTRTALQVGGSGCLFGRQAAGTSGDIRLGENVYQHSGGSYRRLSGDEVSMYSQTNGTHTFGVAGSSTDNSTIDFTDAMHIDNSGNVGIGTTNPETSLHVSASSSEATQDVAIFDNTTKNRQTSIGLYNGNSMIQGRLNNNAVNSLHLQPSGGAVLLGDPTSASDRQILSGSVGSTGSFGQGFIANKLGVGTKSPLTKFHVKEEASSTDLISRFEATGDVYLQFAANNELDWAIIHGYPDTTDFNLYNYSNNRSDITVLDANGNVGIGQTNPQNLLQVGDHVHVSGSGLVGIGLAAPEADLHISNASPMIILQDENVSNLKHRIIGGGDAGLEFSADINNVGAGYIRFDVANSEAVRIEEGGNVGIGTTNPGSLLHLVSSNSEEPIITIENTNDNDGGPAIALRKNASNDAEADNDTCGNINFQGQDTGNNIHNFGQIKVNSADVTNGLEDGHMQLGVQYNGSASPEHAINIRGMAQGAYVGIGKAATNPVASLHVTGSTLVETAAFHGVGTAAKVVFAYNSSLGQHLISWDSSKLNISADSGDGQGSSNISFLVDNTVHFRIAANGDLTATDTSIGSISDERTKKNVHTYSGSLSMINTLRPVTFEWKSSEKNSGVHRGFIAQEVTSSDAYWVREDSVYSGSADYQYLEGTTSIDEVDDTARTGLVSKLTEKDTMYVSAIQELTQAVRDLRAMITGSTDLNQLKAVVSSSSFV